MTGVITHADERAEGSPLNGASGLWSEEQRSEKGCVAGGTRGGLG